MIFCSGSRKDTHTLREVLDIFSKAIGMEINSEKSTLTTHLLRHDEFEALNRTFPYNIASLDAGLKYLGFSLKPNNYLKQD